MASVQMNVRPEDLSQIPHGSERIPEPGILVIFGASGDLTKRKLLPALFHLEQAGLLPEKFAIVGVARRPLGDEFAADMRAGLLEFGGAEAKDPKLDHFVGNISYFPLNFDDPADYAGLNAELDRIAQEKDLGGKRSFFTFGPMWSRSIFRLLGIPCGIQGWEDLPEPIRAGRQPVIFMANHESLLDPPVLIGSLPIPCVYLAKKEVKYLVPVGWAAMMAGTIFIDRGNRDKAIKSIREAALQIRGGKNVVIFPEGTRKQRELTRINEDLQADVERERNDVLSKSSQKMTEVVKKLWEYIKKNNLQDSANKRMINSDDKLKAIFEKAQFSMFEMNKIVAKHLKNI